MESQLSELYDTLAKINKRVNALNSDTNFIERKSERIESDRNEKYESLLKELNSLKERMKNISSDLEKCSSGINFLGKELKNNVKKEQIREMESKIDEITFEQYVTYNDLKKGL